MTEKTNPFNPNGTVPNNLFAGRADYCLKILKKLSETREGRPASFFLFGERGIGKSALARLIGHVATSQNPKLYSLRFIRSYYTVEAGQSFQGVLEASLNNLTDTVPQAWLQRIKERVGGLFKNGKFTLGAFGVSVEASAAEETRAITLKDQTISILSNIIHTLKETKEPQEQRDGILIIIDEMQNLSDLEGVASLLRGILSTLEFNDLGYVSFLLLGLDQAFDRFMIEEPSARRNFDPIHLDVMPANEAMEVLTKGFESIGLKWDENVLRAKILVTGGYPHSIQVVGRHLVESDTDGNIGEDDWKTAIDMTAGELREKDVSGMYCFSGRMTGRDKVASVLALLGHMTRKELTDRCKQAYGMKNPYQYLPELEKCGAVRILPTGVVELHSQILRTAILSSLLPQIDLNSGVGAVWKEAMKQSFERSPDPVMVFRSAKAEFGTSGAPPATQESNKPGQGTEIGG